MRPPLRVLHCSDFHLDINYRERALSILQSLAALERSLGVEVVLIAGDILESARQPAAFVDEVAEGFLAFRAPIIAIPGNHDVPYSQRDPTSQLFSRIGEKGVYLSSAEGHTIEVADRRLRIWGRGMPEHSPTNDPLANFQPMAADGLWNVVLAHGELLEPGKIAGCSSPIMLEVHGPELANVNYMALGHSHGPSQMEYDRTIMRYSGAATTVGGSGTVTLVDFCDEMGVTISSYSIERGQRVTDS